MPVGRDYEYIENRLIAPCTDAMNAHERLQKLHPELARELMTAIQTFTDETRRIRREIFHKP